MMMILLGAAGDGQLQESEKWSGALRRFPTVNRVAKYGDDDYGVALGLGSIAPSASKPFLYAEGRYVLAFDGWLANRDDLTRSLGLSDDQGLDDTIVAAALMRWGPEALAKMHGDFALSWWDRKERRLHLAVDRTGGRPLFYYVAGQAIFFANLVAPLFMNAQVPRTLDPAMVARAAFTPSISFEDTCFQGVKQLLPGHLLEWTAASGARVLRYWRLDPTKRIRLRRDDDYVDAARDLLDTVVQQALPRTGVAASMLSGGLDSSAVAATVARLTSPDPLHTITLRPDSHSALPEVSPRYFQDEWPIAQAVARMHPSMVAHAVSATLDPLEDMLRNSFFWTGRPPIHLLAPSWLSAGWQQARRTGASTVFVGLSGNATLSATLKPLVRPGLKDIPQALYTAAVTGSAGRAIMPQLIAMAPDWLRRMRRRLRDDKQPWHRWTALREDVADRIRLDEVFQAFESGDRSVSFAQRDRLGRMERTWVARTLSSCNHFRDKVERRDPLGDIRLAEFCLAIPPDQFTRFGKDRFLARRVLADRLPPETLNERRDGRQLAEWFDWGTRSRAFLAAELDGIEASSLGRELIDVPRLRAILENWPADANAAEPQYHALMNILGRGVAIGAFIRWAEGANR